MSRKDRNPPHAEQTARAIAGECIGARVRMLNRAVSRVYDESIRPLGLKFSQMNILTVVTLHGPVQPVEVGRILSLEKSTLSRNVRVMEANGWIESLPGEGGNTQLLRTTPRGQRLLVQAAPGWRKAQAQVKSLLGQTTTAAVRRAAAQMQDAESAE